MVRNPKSMNFPEELDAGFSQGLLYGSIQDDEN